MMKTVSRPLAMLLACLLVLSAAVFVCAALPTKEDAVRNTVTQFFDTYMNAMVTKTHPDFSSIMEDTTNTELHQIIINYEVDSAILYNVGFTDYDYTLDYTKLDVIGTTAQVALYQMATIQFESFERGRLSKRRILFSFDLKEETEGWRIVSLHSNHEIFTGFLEGLGQSQESSTYSADIVQRARAQAKDWMPEIADLSDEDLAIIRGGSRSNVGTAS